MDIETLLMLAFGEDDRGMIVVIRNLPDGGGTSGAWVSKGVDVSSMHVADVLEEMARRFRRSAAEREARPE